MMDPSLRYRGGASSTMAAVNALVAAITQPIVGANTNITMAASSMVRDTSNTGFLPRKPDSEPATSKAANNPKA